MDEKEMRAWTVIMENNVQRQGDDLWKVTSSTETTKVYSVIRWGKNDLRCDCMGFRHYKNCKHIGNFEKITTIVGKLTKKKNGNNGNHNESNSINI